MNTNPLILACIIARCDSRRLPSKHFLPLCSLNTLDYILSSIASSRFQIIPIIATSDRLIDQPLEEYSLANNLLFFRGSFESPLDRIKTICDKHNPELILKINGDSPFISYELIDLMIEQYFSTKAGLITAKGQYIGLPVGLGPELLTTKMVSSLHSMTPPHLWESITGYAFQNSAIFTSSVRILKHPFAQSASYQPCTLDTYDDLQRIRDIVASLHPEKPPFMLQSLLPKLSDNV